MIQKDIPLNANFLMLDFERNKNYVFFFYFNLGNKFLLK